MNRKVVLNTPLGEGDVRALHVGEVFYLTGTIFTARDLATHQLLKKGVPAGLDPTGLALYHCGPIVRERSGEWEIIAAGPTTSMRMEGTMPMLIERLGIRLIIGKGGMGPATLKALRRFGAVYGAFTGGAAQTATQAIKGVTGVYLMDELGPVEAVWALDVEHFGPLITAMDAHGNSLYQQVQERAMEAASRLRHGAWVLER